MKSRGDRIAWPEMDLDVRFWYACGFGAKRFKLIHA